MAFDRAAAKADGYTDEEIDQYLATKDQPLPVDQPRSRTEEQIGVVTSAIPDVVKYGLEGAGLYAGGKALAGAIANRGAAPAPVPPTTFTGGANPAFDAALNQPHPQSTPIATAPQPPSAGNFIQRMESLAQRYTPVARAMGSNLVKYAGPAMAVGANLYGTSPEEIATLKAAEQRRRMAAMQQPR